MINRNRNSAVAKAQADMKCAVNSSSRQLNSGRADNINPKYIAPKDRVDAIDYKGYSIVKIQENDYTFTTPDEELDSRSFKSVADAKRAIDAELGDVNSSRRSIRSANRLNSSRYTKDKMIKAMEAAGYYYDDIDSNDANYVVFESDYGPLRFDNMNDVAEWLDGVVFDDPEVADAVDAILNSNRRVNSSRRPSLKTRKAVEYSINCARRRARLNNR